MKKVNFCELDAENKETAVSQILNFKKKYDWPSTRLWKDENEIKERLDWGYNPDKHFSFYLNEFNEVETKIG